MYLRSGGDGCCACLKGKHGRNEELLEEHFELLVRELSFLFGTRCSDRLNEEMNVIGE